MVFEKFSKALLIFIITCTLAFLYYINNLRFNYNFESFFSTKDQSLSIFNQHRATFENDNDFLLIGIVNRPSIYDSVFLTNVEALSNGIRKLPNVTQVESLLSQANLIIHRDPIFNMEIPTRIPFIHSDNWKRLAADSSYLQPFKELKGSFITNNQDALAIMVKLPNMIPREDAGILIQQLDSLTANYNFEEIHIAGKAKAETVYVKKMQHELLIFVSSSFMLIVFFLFIAYRSLWGVILPLSVVLLSVIWSLGAMGVGGKSIDLMTVLLPTIMFVVGMSDVVHFITKYLEELRNGTEKFVAIKKTIHEIGLATFLTSLTTAIGFVTLISTGIVPIQEFGIYSAIGVFLAFILAFTFLPSVLSLLPIPKMAIKKNNEAYWNRKLHLLFLWIINNKWKVVIGCVLITATSIAGIAKIEQNSYLIDEVSDSDPLKQDFLFFEKEFSGVRPFEINIRVNEEQSSIFSYEVIQEIDKVEKYLAKNFNITNFISPTLFFKTLNRSYNGGNAAAYVIPGTEREYRKIKKQLALFEKRKELDAIVDSSKTYGRISSKIVDIGSKRMNEKNNALIKFIQDSTDTRLVSFNLTGSANLIDKTNSELSNNMMKGLAIAFAAIALIMGLLYRSFRIVIISFIPNIIPLLIIGGIIGYSGIGLKMSTSIIFTIAFGIAVDDTIHFMSKLRLELRKEKSLLYAIKNTFVGTGKAIIVTSIILVGGFLTLIYSDFNGTFFTGLFISLCLFFAVMADLLLIPVLLLLFYKKK